jgi:hypothetical protein
MGKSLGEVGYEMWRSLLPAHATNGLPAWNRLPASGQAGWQEVAEAIVAQYDARHVPDSETGK